jgi:long-chain acyl-CoA synthetase
MPYSGYVDLASRPEVYDLIQQCVEQVNTDLAAEVHLAGSQIRRFLVLHKELDADDDELTRTRKVRRMFVAQKYALLVDALYSGQTRCRIETEVKFEDGRRGKIEADVVIREAQSFPLSAVKAA